MTKKTDIYSKWLHLSILKPNKTKKINFEKIKVKYF